MINSLNERTRKRTANNQKRKAKAYAHNTEVGTTDIEGTPVPVDLSAKQARLHVRLQHSNRTVKIPEGFEPIAIRSSGAHRAIEPTTHRSQLD